MIIFLLIGCASGLPEWKLSEYDIGPKVMEGGVRFAVYAPDAEGVNLVGDFNNWSKESDPLSDRDRDGVWEIVIPIPPGSYQYKYVIDNEEWIPDPANPKSVEDGFGGKNSVININGG